MTFCNLDKEKIKKILLRGGYIKPEDAWRAERVAKTHRISAVEQFLIGGLITKNMIGQAIAQNFGVPYADLNSSPPTKKQVLDIPGAISVTR